MSAGRFTKRAVDPSQYDLADVIWSDEIGLNSPTREWFWENLQSYSPLWMDKDILDIGCGTGWLLSLLTQNGASSVEGFDPSKKSCATAQKLHPELNVLCKDINSFSSSKRYDLIVSIMSFGHIVNIESAFKKIISLLKPDGSFLLFVPSYDYFRKARYDYVVKIEDINDDEYVTQVTRPHWGTIAEIVRRPGVFKAVGQKMSLELVEEVGLKPSPNLIRREPRYEETKTARVVDLLHFRNSPPKAV